MANPGRLHDWIEALPSEGRYVFTRAEARSVSKASSQAVEVTLRRLKKRAAIITVRGADSMCWSLST